MRHLSLGLILSALAGCPGEKGTTDSATSGTDASSTGAGDSSTGDEPTGTTSEPPGTSTLEPTSIGSDPTTTGPQPPETTTDEPEPFSQPVTIEPDCAPDDGPAVRLRFPDERLCGGPVTGQVVEIVLFESLPLAPGEYPVGGSGGIATFQIGDDPPKIATGGFLQVTVWGSESFLGAYELEFEEENETTQLFAPMIEGPICDDDPPLCG